MDDLSSNIIAEDRNNKKVSYRKLRNWPSAESFFKIIIFLVLSIDSIVVLSWRVPKVLVAFLLLELSSGAENIS